MTLTDLLPVRIGLFDRTARPVRKHRALDEIDRLRAEVARQRTLLDGAHALIAGLQMQNGDAEVKQAAAEELVVQQQADIDEITEERDELRDEVLMFRARFGPQLAAEANAQRITVPRMIRDTSAVEDQATGPIDVRSLWEARDAGLLGPVTDPSHVHGQGAA